MAAMLRERVADRLATLGINPFEAARRGELERTFVNDILVGKKRSVRGENLAKLAKALESTTDYLLGGDGAPGAALQLERSDLIPASKAFSSYAPLRGNIQAGVWLEAEVFDDDLGEAISAPRDPDFPHARQVAFRVRGESMNNANPTPIQDGDFVICVMFEDIGLELRSGMVVVVERTRDAGHSRERSLKEVRIFDDRIEFCPRSTDSRFKPIVVARDLAADDGTKVQILALLRFTFTGRPVPVP